MKQIFIFSPFHDSGNTLLKKADILYFCSIGLGTRPRASLPLLLYLMAFLRLWKNIENFSFGTENSLK